MQSSNNRLNYNVPRHLVQEIRNIASQLGVEPAFWLRKVLEQAVQESATNPKIPTINFDNLEVFGGENDE